MTQQQLQQQHVVVTFARRRGINRAARRGGLQCELVQQRHIYNLKTATAGLAGPRAPRVRVRCSAKSLHTSQGIPRGVRDVSGPGANPYALPTYLLHHGTRVRIWNLHTRMYSTLVLSMCRCVACTLYLLEHETLLVRPT